MGDRWRGPPRLGRRGTCSARAVLLRHRGNAGLACRGKQASSRRTRRSSLPLDPDNVLLPNCEGSAVGPGRAGAARSRRSAVRLRHGDARRHGRSRVQAGIPARRGGHRCGAARRRPAGCWPEGTAGSTSAPGRTTPSGAVRRAGFLAGPYRPYRVHPRRAQPKSGLPEQKGPPARAGTASFIPGSRSPSPVRAARPPALFLARGGDRLHAFPGQKQARFRDLLRIRGRSATPDAWPTRSGA
jgi:hypothetical protein